MDQRQIRNFCIIAHIDHGKSTLADRFLEMTGTVAKRDLKAQTLDSHPISRERGITIKLAPVTMNYRLANIDYFLNLIDTPGHVDFSYEVERSLAACEGAILLVDATAGIQAQTLSHLSKARALGLMIIPAINKIDVESANISGTLSDLRETSGFDSEEIFQVSAKTGQGVDRLLEAVVSKIPAPEGKSEERLRALVFSSQYDAKRGVVAFVRIVDGSIEKGENVELFSTKESGNALEIGRFYPDMREEKKLLAGDVGYVVTNIKKAEAVKIGDTLTTVEGDRSKANGQQKITPLPGYRQPKPMVFVSFFPVDQNDYKQLLESLLKLKLNDAALTFSPIGSKALGRGFRCGFLGHLHAEITKERLEQDFNLNILATTPTVEYRTNGQQYEEPWVKAVILVPKSYLGGVITLCEDRRGILINMDYHGENVTLVYEMPLSEIITDFFDRLKSSSSGYASIDYEIVAFRPFEAARLEILINHESVDAFSAVLPRERAERYGRYLTERLKEAIPRQQIPIPIQAVLDGQVIAREDIPTFRKDVTAKLYGGDYTRKLKLLSKQKEGKKKMKMIGKVEIPSDTFLKIFRT